MNSLVIEIGIGLFQLALAMALCWFVYRVILRMLGLTRPTEAEPPADFAGKPVGLKPRPKKGAGSVAVAEPDEDD